jgi:hypothetical protein
MQLAIMQQRQFSRWRSTKDSARLGEMVIVADSEGFRAQTSSPGPGEKGTQAATAAASVG